MAYVTVSTWQYEEGHDEQALIESAEKNLGILKAMGAREGHLVKTSPTEGLIVLIYPDEGTWNRVRETVLKLRNETRPETGGVLTESFAGAAICSA